MMSRNVREIVLINGLWKLGERIGNQVVSFVVSIVLARLLTPDVFGTIALVLVFTTILNVFVDSGFGTALIQKKDADDLDFSTVFFFNMIMCFVLYGIMYCGAPYIALYYRDPLLTPVIRVLSLTLIVSGLRTVQQAYISRTMQFRLFFFSTISGTIVSAAVGIPMAYLGYGVWALVAQSLVNVAFGTLILWFTVKWRPKCKFSLGRLRGLFSFGWKMLASALINTGYRGIWQLVIGKIYTTTDLGIYNRGEQIPTLLITNINASIDSILLPVMSREQDDIARVRAMSRRSIKVSTYIIAPMMMGVAFIGTPLIRLLLTEKWLPCVPFMTVFCVAFMFYPIHTANLNAITALGRSDLFLKLEIVKKAIGIAALLFTMRISVMAMAYSVLFTSIASQIINSWPNKKLLKYGYLEQIIDILPSIMISIAMGLSIYPIRFLGLSDLLTLSIQVPMGILIYVILSKVFKIDSYDYLTDVLKSQLKRRRK